MARAIRLAAPAETKHETVTFGVCATCDPRVDEDSRKLRDEHRGHGG